VLLAVCHWRDFAGLVLVDFRARTSAAEAPFGLALEQLARDYRGRVRFVQLDIEGNTQLCSCFEVTAPGVVLIENGCAVDRITSAEPNFSEVGVRAMLRRRLPLPSPGDDCDDGSCRV